MSPQIKKLFTSDLFYLALCILFFLLFPYFDIKVSSLFYDFTEHSFTYKNNFLVQTIYKLTNIIAYTLVLGLIAVNIISWLTKNGYFKTNRKIFSYLLLALIVGPGLLVNATFKENWDRPRPRNSEIFGGKHQYEPPFSPSFECNRCQSFVSGHSSVGFYFFSLVFVMKKRRWFLLPLTLGCIIGATRMIQGGHFLSDVIFSGWVVWLSSKWVYWFMFRNSATPHSSEQSL